MRTPSTQAYRNVRSITRKALKEMVHRYLAGDARARDPGASRGSPIANRRDPQQPMRLPLVLVGLVVFQGTARHVDGDVAAQAADRRRLHLLGGLTTLGAAVVAWSARRLRARERPAQASVHCAAGRHRAGRAGVADHARRLDQQQLRGGRLSRFPDLPELYWPHMDFKDAFVLWRGLGIDYEGGVLDHPARVAIHFCIDSAQWSRPSFSVAEPGSALRAGQARGAHGGRGLGVALIAQLLLGSAHGARRRSRCRWPRRTTRCGTAAAERDPLVRPAVPLIDGTAGRRVSYDMGRLKRASASIQCGPP